MRIIFLGTPDFAVSTLQALIHHGYNVVAVVTAPDKPAGRGMQIQQSAVKQCAVEHNIKVLQPVKLKDEAFIAELKSLQADVQIVVAFRMLPEVVWSMPPLGTINVHASLLPNYRGAAPINWAIINGENVTGVTTFKLQHAIDTGNILLQKTLPITLQDNVGTMYEKLKIAGADLLIETLQGLQHKQLHEVKQDELSTNNALLQHAPKLTSETGLINFNNTAQQVNNLIRGLSPIPAAYTFLQGKKLKIFASSVIEKTHQLTKGEYVTDGKTYLHFACNNSLLNVIELQLEGKKRMLVEDFLRGYKL